MQRTYMLNCLATALMQEGEKKSGRLPEKEGDYQIMADIIIGISQLSHCCLLVQFLVFFVVSSPSQALFPGS